MQREELLRLVEELPEEEVPAVLDDVRRHLRAVKDRSWPPAWFGAGEGRTDDVAARSEDLPRGRFRSSGVIVCDTGPLVAAALANDSPAYATSASRATRQQSVNGRRQSPLSRTCFPIIELARQLLRRREPNCLQPQRRGR